MKQESENAVFKKIYDPNKTVRHLSYRQMREHREQDMHRTERVFRAIIDIALAALAIFGAAWLLLD